MTPELVFGFVGLLIGILTVGAALAWLIVAGLASVRADLRERTGMLEARMAAMETRMSAMETRMSSVERELGRTQGLIDGLRAAQSSAAAAD